MEDNITRPYKGLHTDNSSQDQPKGTHKFGLNSVTESETGDENFISNEESNEECAKFPQHYIPIGKKYIGDGKNVIFLVNKDETLSEIGILDNNCNYETHVNANLNFKINHQIDSTYRLRRGCERNIYFTDGLNKPRIYNFDKPEDFKNATGDWDTDKFNLFKVYNTIPTFDNVEILQSGQLLPGSYNFAIQYLDEDLNPTEWITTTDTIIIYNDNFTSKPFSEIRGSTNKKTDYQDFGVTNKAIQLSIGNLDSSFAFYRVAIIEANNGSGKISRVVYSSEISTKITSYIYTGENAFTKGTEEEIQQFNNVIETAEHIEQIENRLIFGNIEGKQLNYCKLQKYASKIKADIITEKIRLNDINIKNNQKRGQTHLENIGYMPGEIYSFGIVYVFEDGTTSPVYHIPGRNSSTSSNMSSDNELRNAFYTDNNNCSDQDYWGVDCENEVLVGKAVRHHRFPLRSEINKPLIEKVVNVSGSSTIESKTLYLTISGTINNDYSEDSITYSVSYTINNVTERKENTIDVSSYDPAKPKRIKIVSTLDNIRFLNIQEKDENNNFVTPFSGLSYAHDIETNVNTESTTEDIEYYSEIFGINFTNIDRPSLSDTNGKKITGYYIVRNERTEEHKTILDTGILCPLIKEKDKNNNKVKFVAHGHLLPETDKIQKDVFALIHPENKFNHKEYANTTELIQEGEFSRISYNAGSKILQDVQPGTSYNSENHDRREKDSDGFSLHILNRNNNLTYTNKTKRKFGYRDIKQIFYLNSLFNKSITNIDKERQNVFNVSADNKIGVIQLNRSMNIPNTLPYVVMKRNLSNSYSGFRVLPYYKETANPHSFHAGPRNDYKNNNSRIFNGDSYVSPMKYVSSMFYDIKLRHRESKSSIWNYIIGVLTTIVGTVLSFTGVGTAAGIALIGFGVSQIATGIKRDQIAKVYSDLYEQGLKDTVADKFTDKYFGGNPKDDTIQWFFESLTNIWFESSVNINWRMGATVGITDFLNSPTGYDKQYYLQYFADKITTLDPTADDGRTYQGFAKAEIYEVNPDYRRRDKQKIFHHLGLEYDCCSKCIEEFPHRISWSQQSYQEELTDNYRVFLPNNYRDIEGETGHITNIFRIQNNLYIHTKEGLWYLPQNIQERITNEIVSFIGTGSFFSIPPRLIVDGETGNSAGNQHKWGTIKTPHGVFFITENQAVIYQFDGKNLKPISANGMFNWFKNNISLTLDNLYYKKNKKPYPYKNNPSNFLGTGFVSVYDSKKERIIFTKKDFLIKRINNDDYNYDLYFQDKEILISENLKLIDYSWTISYSLKSNSWQSWHSYLPNFYIHSSNMFYSWIHGNNTLWKHNKKGHYQNFYGSRYPFIVEFVSLSNPLVTRIWEYLRLITEAKRFNQDLNEFVDERFITFNKGLFYNSRQSSGILNLMVKDTNSNNEDYLLQQVQNLNGDTIIIDRNERDWTINELRDIRTNYSEPLFNSKHEDLQNKYYIDKLINTNSVDYNKNWTELESFRDKYLVVRLIFDNFDNIKLLLNYSVENEQRSFR